MTPESWEEANQKMGSISLQSCSCGRGLVRNPNQWRTGELASAWLAWRDCSTLRQNWNIWPNPNRITTYACFLGRNWCHTFTDGLFYFGQLVAIRYDELFCLRSYTTNTIQQLYSHINNILQHPCYTRVNEPQLYTSGLVTEIVNIHLELSLTGETIL